MDELDNRLDRLEEALQPSDAPEDVDIIVRKTRMVRQPDGEVKYEDIVVPDSELECTSELPREGGGVASVWRPKERGKAGNYGNC
jgi:hypothetical protein